MSTEIEDQISNYFEWVETRTGFDLRPTQGRVPGSVDSGTNSDADSSPFSDVEPRGEGRQRSRDIGRTALLAVAATVVLVGGLVAIVSRPSADPVVPPVAQAPVSSAPCASNPVRRPGWDPCVEMKVFVGAEATSAAITSIEDVLMNATDVIAEWTYLDAEAALEEARRTLADEPGTLALLTVDNIPTTFELVPTAAATETALRQLAIELRRLPAVFSVMTRDQVDPSPQPPSDEVADQPASPVETTHPPASDLVPAAPPQLVAIGDSVMLGAADELIEAGFLVDAMQSRSFQQVLPVVELAISQQPAPDALVLGVGTNGPISSDDLDAVASALAEVPRVVMLTVGVDRAWVAENNRLIEALPERFPNVVVVDWARAAADCVGDCFFADGMHLKQDGQDLYTDLIVEAATSSVLD